MSQPVCCIHCHKLLENWACSNPKCLLACIDQYPDDLAMCRDYRQRKIVELAVSAADRVIMDNTDGSVEETNWLTSSVAMKFVEKTHCSLSSQLLRKEIMPQEETTMALLQASLGCAVSLWIDKLKSVSWAELEQRRARCAEIIAHHGDNILYRSKKVGETAEAFNALAEAVAILSFVPGGVKVFGLEFKSYHPEGKHNGPPAA